MKTPFWRRWFNSLRCAKPAGRASSARPRRRLFVETLEDRVTPSLTPQMVLDINSGTAWSSPSQMVAIGSTIYFSADDGVHGVELWKSDGTAAGTTLVKDIYPGSSYYSGLYGSAWYPSSSSPRDLTNVEGTLFFTANDGTSGEELWKSDGTEAGTVLVKDIRAGSSGSVPSDLTNINGTLFFSADEGTNGIELWKSDGTVAGTVLVKDINPGSGRSDPNSLTNVNGTLFFSASEGTNGIELWKSDGTEAGTVLVKDINSGSNSAYPRYLTSVNGTLFFRAIDGTNSWELWKSDGTEAGTVLVKDINPGSAGSYPRNLTNVNGTLFFSAYNVTTGQELWKSDGTATGTVLAKDIGTGSNGSFPNSLTNVNGTLFFSANDGYGTELWKSDGTQSGTTLVKDINPFSSSSYSRYLTNVNGTLFFEADSTTGPKLWQSDGTEAGTVPAANFGASSLTNVNGTLFFSADDGAHGQELWKLVDDASQGTSLQVSGFPATITAGVAGSFTVTAANANGVTDTNYTGTIHFTSSDPLAQLPADYTFIAADQGVHGFSATLKTAGTQSITATDTIPGGLVGTQTGITVNPAAASTFTVTGFPSPTIAGVAHNFTITGLDPYGNLAAGYTGTVHFSSNDAQAVLPPDSMLTDGMGQFSATLNTAGTQSLTATDTTNASLNGMQGGITVNPPPPPPTITMSDVTVSEGNSGTQTATFTVTLSTAYDQAVAVNYATANGTAIAGSDYQAASGTLTIPAGQTTGTITILVNGDRLPESNETFSVNLSSPNNATIADGQGQGTIIDDEPRISISDVTKSEGKKGQTTLFTFTVTLSAAYDQAVTMSHQTVNGTATTGDSDYIAKTGTLTFAPGETTKTITIEVKGDSKKEADETFYLDLFGNSSNSLFTKNRGLGTILNDD